MSSDSLDPDRLAAQDLFSTYITWAKTLHCQLTFPLTITAFTNCVNFSEILHRIDDTFFTEDWVSSFAQYDEDSSWRVKSGNLKKLMKRLYEYFDDVCKKNVSCFPMWIIDEQMLCTADVYQMNKVFSLVIGAAILGKNNQEFVGIITQQSFELQQAVADIVTVINSNSGDPAIYLSDTGENSDASKNSSCDVERINTLARENEELKISKTRLESDLTDLQQKLDIYRSQPSAEKLLKEKEELKLKKAELEGKVMDLEEKCESLNNNCEEKEAELEQIKSNVGKIHVFEEEYQRLKDECDELRVREDDYKKMSRDLEIFKQRSKDAASERAELQVLRERIARYMDEIVTLEDEKQKNKAFRQQIASLKVQLEEKETAGEKTAVRMHKLELELAETKEKLMVAEKKNEYLVEEKLALSDKITELELNTSIHNDSLRNALGSPSLNAEEQAAPPENYVTRVLDLEKELSRARERIKELENLEDDQREWISTKRRNQELESELQLATAKKQELSTKINELEQQMDNKETSADVTQLRIQIEQITTELRTTDEKRQISERNCAQTAEALKKSEEIIKQKDAEIAKREDTIKKSKQLIANLDNRVNITDETGLSRHEFESLRKEIQLKDKKIESLKEELQRTGANFEEEQRLIVTSFYSMADRTNKLSRLENSDQARSLLSKQKAAGLPNVSIIILCSVLVIFCVIFSPTIKGFVNSPPDLV